MSSILSKIRDGKWQLPRMDPEARANILPKAEFLATRIRRTGPEAPKLVNMQSVVRDLAAPTGTDDSPIETHFDKLPPVTPCFPELWLECIIHGMKAGFFVRRGDRADGWDIFIATWEERLGEVIGPTVVQQFDLPKNGRVAYGSPVATVVCRVGQTTPDEYRFLNLRLFTVLSALARMNCRNVELRQIAGAKAPRYQGSPRPASIWHEIHISSVPRRRTTGKDATGQVDGRLIRCHWMRGHYHDYGDGPGLFGNPNLRGHYWIPERQQGNPDLGHVIPEYVLEK